MRSYRYDRKWNGIHRGDERGGEMKRTENPHDGDYWVWCKPYAIWQSGYAAAIGDVVKYLHDEAWLDEEGFKDRWQRSIQRLADELEKEGE